MRKLGPEATYRRLCTILWEQKRLDLVETICEVLKCSHHSCSFHTHPHHLPITPLQLQSPVHRYANYLRAIYKRSELPEYSNPACYKWMPCPGKKFQFINLAVISKEEITEKEADKLRRETIHGHIDLILKRKAPIALENILQVAQGQSLTCVLIEGAPGIGKSMLGWEICRRWGRGELFQEYSVVLLVTLRDDRVHKAASMVDLFYHRDKNLQAEVVQEIDRTNGRGILILLEGLDELPRHLLTGYSIFTNLLSGAIFPEATVLVTSRPSATDKLWQRWWQKKSRHIEILGFTEDKVTEYTKSVLSDRQISGFNTYLSINPCIKSMMYVPLHCVIAIAVYLQCLQSVRPPPKTLTGLYTRLAQIILVQYLKDHPDYKGKECMFNSFSDLPSPVYSLFKKLCHLAFDGVSSQQLVFLDIPQSLDHLGFMDAVPEQFSHPQQSASFSYNFLHFSVQEYLAAYHISLLSPCEQKQLLQTVRYRDHHFNMTRFLAGITKFKDLDEVIVKKVIGISDSDVNSAKMSGYTLEFLYECQDVSILDSEYCYSVSVKSSKYGLMALGYTVSSSSSRWNLTFKGIDSPYHFPKKSYNVESIKFISCSSEFIDSFLLQLPHVLHITSFISENEYQLPPLPSSIPELIPRMGRLHTLKLDNTLPISLNRLVALLSTHIPGLKVLSVCDSREIFADGGKVPARLIPRLISSVPTMKSFSIISKSESDYFKIQFPNSSESGTIDIKCELSAPLIFEQFLHQLSQETISHIGSFLYHNGKLIYDEDEDVDDIGADEDVFKSQALPPCLPELLPRMERLNTLTLENVLVTVLTELLPALSRVPTLMNLSTVTDVGEFKCTIKVVSGCSEKSQPQLQPYNVDLEYHNIEESEEVIQVFDQILQQLLQEKIVAHIRSFRCNSGNVSHYYIYDGPLLPSLPKLCPQNGETGNTETGVCEGNLSDWGRTIHPDEFEYCH